MAWNLRFFVFKKTLKGNIKVKNSVRAGYPLIFSSLIMMNINLITGYNVQSYHWNIAVLAPISLVMVLIVSSTIFSQKYKTKT